MLIAARFLILHDDSFSLEIEKKNGRPYCDTSRCSSRPFSSRTRRMGWIFRGQKVQNLTFFKCTIVRAYDSWTHVSGGRHDQTKRLLCCLEEGTSSIASSIRSALDDDQTTYTCKCQAHSFPLNKYKAFQIFRKKLLGIRQSGRRNIASLHQNRCDRSQAYTSSSIKARQCQRVGDHQPQH